MNIKCRFFNTEMVELSQIKPGEIFTNVGDTRCEWPWMRTNGKEFKDPMFFRTVSAVRLKDGEEGFFQENRLIKRVEMYDN